MATQKQDTIKLMNEEITPKQLLSEAIVTTKTILKDQQMQCGILRFMPVACYAYLVGKNTLRRTRNLYGL